ncbi:MAG: type II secretion system protein [Phycisphaerae bacterium]|nr:type II secretion system protein [Phycisphaerae bacterium]
MNPGRPHILKRGFTLIELLVVIAIISLLVSILLPSLTLAKELAKRAVCASQLRGIVTAAAMYASDDAQGNIPPATKGNDARIFPHILSIGVVETFRDYGADPFCAGAMENEWYFDRTGMWQCPSCPYYLDYPPSGIGHIVYTSYLYIGSHEKIGGMGKSLEEDQGHLTGFQDSSGDARAVIVADVIMQGQADNSLQVNHVEGGGGAKDVSSAVPAGTHRGYRDGGVLWIDQDEFLDEYDLGDSLDWQHYPRYDTAYGHSSNYYWW